MLCDKNFIIPGIETQGDLKLYKKIGKGEAAEGKVKETVGC